MTGNKHIERIREMMHGFGQDCPTKPEIPSAAIRRLRAKLVIEEAIEFANACGFEIHIDGGPYVIELSDFVKDAASLDRVGQYTLIESLPPYTFDDFVDAVDGLADGSVVGYGSAIAFGVDIEPILEIVDNNNLLKIATGSKCPDTGKFIKHPNHPTPTAEIAAEIIRQQNA